MVLPDKDAEAVNRKSIWASHMRLLTVEYCLAVIMLSEDETLTFSVRENGDCSEVPMLLCPLPHGPLPHGLS